MKVIVNQGGISVLPLSDVVIVGVVSRRDFNSAGSEVSFHKRVENNWKASVDERMKDVFSVKVGVSRILEEGDKVTRIG